MQLRDQVHSTARRVCDEWLKTGYLPPDFLLWWDGRARQPQRRIDKATNLRQPNRGDLAFEDFRLWAAEFLQHEDRRVAA